MSTPSAPIAVIGATGQQGGAALSALLERGVAARAVIRDGGRADELAGRGAEVVIADLRDHDALTRALGGVDAAFAMTTMSGPDGPDGEIADGHAIADAAREAGTPRLVYSSVGGADRATGIPHFESKWDVERYLRRSGVPTVVIRPVFFMENLTSLFAPSEENGELVLRLPLAGDVPLQLIAVRDIGRVAAGALLDPEAVPGGAVEIGVDEQTPEAIAQAFGVARGTSARFEALPVDSLDSDDARRMFRWFAELPAYQADVATTRALAGGSVTDLAAFLADTGVTDG